MSFDALKKFVRCNVDDTEIEATVIVEKALEWLEANETVKAYVTDGTYSKHDVVKEIEKKEDETAITTISGDVFHIKKNDSNVREIKVEYFSRDYYYIWREKLTKNQAKRICANGEDADVRAIGYSNGKPITTSRIKRFITDDSFETESGSIYKIHCNVDVVLSEVSSSEKSSLCKIPRFSYFKPRKPEISDFDTLEAFYLLNEDMKETISRTVDADEARKWLASNKPVFAQVKTGTRKERRGDFDVYVSWGQVRQGRVSQVEKNLNEKEIVVTFTSGETFHLSKVRGNNIIG